MRRFLIVCLALFSSFAPSIRASTDEPGSVLKRASRLSSLTGPGAKPFHAKLTVSEPENLQSPYTATVEEFWQSPNDWYRTIDSPGFRQHIVVAAGRRDEQNVGRYYPLWLRSFVTAAFDPLEDASFWQQVSARIVVDDASSSRPGSSCARAQYKIGTTAVTNDAFAVICFNADGTLSSLVRPGYGMEFHDQQEFSKKRIALRYVDHPEPGTELVGRLSVLEALPSSAPLPHIEAFDVASSGPILIVPIKQETFESLATTSTVLNWPSVRSGNTSGKLSMYVSTDREGHVREAYPLNSDNAGLQDFAREQLLKWQLRPARVDGQQVQTEAAVTFAFSTTVTGETGPAGAAPSQDPSPASKPIEVSQVVSAALRTKSYAPVYPEALKKRYISGSVTLSAVIGTEGQIISVTPTSSTDPEFTKAAIAAVQQWRYKPYLLNGSPVEILTPITLNFKAR